MKTSSYLCTMEKERRILYYKEYFMDFFMSINPGAQRKVAYILEMLKTQQRLSSTFIKHIREGIYELRASPQVTSIGHFSFSMKEI